MRPDLERVRKIVATVVQGAGFELWGIEFGTDRGRPVLRIYVDGPGGIDLNTITRLTRMISPALDVEDPIPFAYNLEVSSPGLDRKIFTLEQYDRLKGSKVRILLKEPDPTGRKRFKGILEGTDGREIVLRLESGEVRLSFDDIEEARVIYEMPKDLF